MRLLPDFILIGAPHCGAGVLHEQLARQPGIYMPPARELPFFSKDEVFAHGPRWYIAHFAQADDQDLCGQTSVTYTMLPTYPRTVERLVKYVPDARLIYLMRHPIDRLLAHCREAASAAGAAAGLERALERAPWLIDYGCYAMQVRPYLEAFGSQAVLPVFYERLMRDPQRELERVCRFIGHAATSRWHADLDVNHALRAVRSRPASRPPMPHRNGAHRARRRLLPQAVRSRMSPLTRIAAEIRPAMLQRLADRFDEDLAQLRAWLGVSIRCDNFRRIACCPAQKPMAEHPAPNNGSDAQDMEEIADYRLKVGN